MISSEAHKAGEGLDFADLNNETVPRLSVAKGNGSATTTGYHIIKMFENAEVYKYEKSPDDTQEIPYLSFE